MDALSGVPGSISLHVSDSENFVLKHAVVHSLSKILYLTQLILSDCFMVFYSFLYNNRLGESLVVAFRMHTHGGTIQNFLLSKAESVIYGINREVVLALLLLTRVKVSVGLSVHFLVFFSFLLRSTLRVKDFFGRFRANSSRSKRDLAILCLVGPLVASLVTLPKRFTFVRCVFILFNVVENFGEAVQILCFDNLINVIGAVSSFSVCVVFANRLRILRLTRMHLFNSRLVPVRFPELFN